MRSLFVFSLITALAAASGCTVRARAPRTTYRAGATVSFQVPQYVEVTAQPPAARAAVTVRPTQPDPSAVWVPGHYEWSGGSWVWVDGQWATGHADDKWVDPVVSVEDGRTIYHPGYWCPRDQAPAPAYTGPGVVVVAAGGGTLVQPTRQGTVVEPTRQGGGTAVEPTRQGGGTAVEPTRQGGGTAVEPTRQAGGTPVEPTRRGGVSATPAGGQATSRYDAPDATAQGGQGSVTVRGDTPQRGSVTVRGGGSASAGGGATVRGGTSRGGTASASGGSGTTRGGTPSASGGSGTTRGGTVATPDARPATGQPTVSARTDQRGSATAPAPGTTARTDQRGSATAPAPGVTARTDQRGSATAPPPRQPAGTVVAGRNPNPGSAAEPQRVALTCAVTTPRAPRGGAVTIRGTGFQRPTVRIGGQVVRISRSTATELVVAAPNAPGGGDVRVSDAGREATCGRIEVR